VIVLLIKPEVVAVTSPISTGVAAVLGVIYLNTKSKYLSDIKLISVKFEYHPLLNTI